MTAPTRSRKTTPESTPNRATSTRPERSSKRSARKTPLGWLPWLLLGLLALLLALTFLVINSLDDDGPDGPAGDTLGQSGSNGSGLDGQDGDGKVAGTEGDGGSSSEGESGTGSTGTTGSSGTTRPSGAGAGGAAGTLTAGGQDLLAGASGSLGALAGQSASGNARVQSVVADEGFWVGADESNRVFVFLSPEARRSAGESGFQVEEGQTVSLEGTVSRSDASFADRTGVTADEGRQQLLDQGAYVDATRVELAR